MQHWSKLSHHAGEPCPVGRTRHATVCLGYGGDQPQLLVTGGVDSDDNILSDVWLLDVESRRWREVRVLGSVLAWQACSQPCTKGGSFFKKGCVAYIYIYKFMYIVWLKGGVLDDPPNPPWLRACMGSSPTDLNLQSHKLSLTLHKPVHCSSSVHDTVEQVTKQ